MRSYFLGPLHPRLQVTYIQEHVFRAKPAREPVVQKLRLAPGVIMAVADKRSYLRPDNVCLPPGAT